MSWQKKDLTQITKGVFLWSEVDCYEETEVSLESKLGIQKDQKPVKLGKENFRGDQEDN